MKLILANGDGMKGINPWDVDSHPEAWTWLSGQPAKQQDEFYATVSAAFRAYNLKANTVGSVPFALYKLGSDEEYDNSNEWQNKVKFLPNPSELLRLNTLSYITSNAIYNLRTSDALGYKTKGLYHALPYSFTPVVNNATQQLDYVTRQVGSTIERYTPDDKRLIRMWRLDHTTEVLPSANTEAKAVMKSAGIMYYQDAWVEHFYRRGGIKPTLIAMKGLINSDDKDKKERDWGDFLRGLGKFTSRVARIFNAEAMDIKPFGSGVDDLKDNHIYRQAIENIAMGTGMPLSLLLANSSNYATAQEEKATWYESDIIPFCRWMAYEYNRQLWNPIGLYMAFLPQTLDPNQQDETEKASAMKQYNEIITACATYEIFIGLADTMGVEISPSLDDALKKYYADKKQEAEAVTVQPVEENPEEEPEEDEPMEEPAPAKWIPSLDEMNELRVWREVALRRHKKGESLEFDYQPHYGGLPESVMTDIKARLAEAREWSADTIKTVFTIAQMVARVDAPEVKANTDIIVLAASLDKLADAMAAKNVNPS